jgi:hypothetical protein
MKIDKTKLRFTPTADHRSTVKLLAGFGMPHCDICLFVLHKDKPISEAMLRDFFCEELAIAPVEMDRLAITSLAVQIRKGNVAAIGLYMKNRMGWRDVSSLRKRTVKGLKRLPIRYLSR